MIKKHIFSKYIFIFLIIILGFTLRIWVSTFGANYDFESYTIVAEIVRNNENIYAATSRYNYGPIWFQILNFLYSSSIIISRIFTIDLLKVFRFSIPFFLSFVDLGIMLILWKKYGLGKSLIFFFNPISIFISGYHNQFGNLAILVGLVALLFYDEEDNSIWKRIIFSIILGISLTIKHIFIFFPIWLFYKEKNWKLILISIIVPYMVFFLSFIPYIKDGGINGIMANVFFYNSYNNQIFYQWFIPNIIKYIFSAKDLWIILVISTGLFYRKDDIYYSFLIYLLIFSASSPAITNHYLVLPTTFISMNLNPLFILFLIYGVFHFMIDIDGLHIPILIKSFPIARDLSYSILVILLVFGFIWHIFRKQIRAFLQNLVQFRINKKQII